MHTLTHTAHSNSNAPPPSAAACTTDATRLCRCRSPSQRQQQRAEGSSDAPQYCSCATRLLRVIIIIGISIGAAVWHQTHDEHAYPSSPLLFSCSLLSSLSPSPPLAPLSSCPPRCPPAITPLLSLELNHLFDATHTQTAQRMITLTSCATTTIVGDEWSGLFFIQCDDELLTFISSAVDYITPNCYVQLKVYSSFVGDLIVFPLSTLVVHNSR